MMNKYIFCLLTIMAISNLTARAQYLHDIQGKPYMEQSYTEVEGSPYLIANWAMGAVSLVNGKTMAAKLKYDVIKDELLFQNKTDSAVLTFVDPVQHFSFNDAAIDESNLAPLVFGSGYPPVDNQTQASFYQIIADGKVKLLKHYKKTIRVDKAFNSATSTQVFVLADVYYVFVNNQITRIKPSQKTILVALSDKASQLQSYMKSNAVNYKSDAALAKLFGYYNSL